MPCWAVKRPLGPWPITTPSRTPPPPLLFGSIETPYVYSLAYILSTHIIPTQAPFAAHFFSKYFHAYRNIRKIQKIKKNSGDKQINNIIMWPSEQQDRLPTKMNGLHIVRSMHNRRQIIQNKMRRAIYLTIFELKQNSNIRNNSSNISDFKVMGNTIINQSAFAPLLCLATK